ncbi:putative reverse transcriptase domain-containing protein [Tanacetum coccineum]
MVNVIPPDHVDDVPVVEPNQHDDVPVVPEPVLVDEDEDPEEDEFEEEEDPQEEEDDIEVDIEEDENEPELTYPYEETVPASIHEVGESSTAPFLCEDSDGLFPGLMRRDINSLFGQMASLSRQLCGREMAHALVEKKGKAKDKYYGKLILDLGNEVRSSVEQGMDAMEKLVEKLGNAEDKVECKKLKKELEEERLSNTFLHVQNERFERDLYWTRVRAHELYQEMIRRGFVFEERPNEAINVPIKDEKSPSSEPRGSPHDAYHASKARQANVRNDASGSRPVRGQDTAPAIRECTFAGFMKFNPTVFRGVEGVVELRRWFEKTESVFEISECAEGKKVKFAAATLEGPTLNWWKTKVATMGLETVNQMPWTEMKQLMTEEFFLIEEVQRIEHELMVEPERVKVDAYIRGLTDNIKGEVTSSKSADLNEAVRMAHKLMEQNLQARDERILEGKKQKWESFQSVNGSGKAIKSITLIKLCRIAKSKGTRDLWLPLLLMESFLYVNDVLLAMLVSVQSSAISVERLGTRQGHTRNRYPKKIKQEEAGEVRSRAYAIKDAEPQGSNVVTGTFLLNNRYAFVLFDSGSDRSFVDTRFSSMLDIDLVKIGASTNIVLKGCTLNLVNYVFEIDLMLIELGTFDVIIGMDWLVKHDVVIVYGEKVVHIPYGNKMLIVESDKGVSRLKVISCIKARKYVERGCHLFLAHNT